MICCVFDCAFLFLLNVISFCFVFVLSCAFSVEIPFVYVCVVG